MSRNWYTPEYNEGQDERDRKYNRDKFYVYVLDTKFGDYVGHTYDVAARVKQHIEGNVESTKDSDPFLVWQSKPFSTRDDASRFEAVLKSYRQRRHPKFAEITGYMATPFERRYEHDAVAKISALAELAKRSKPAGVQKLVTRKLEQPSIPKPIEKDEKIQKISKPGLIERFIMWLTTPTNHR